MSYCVNCGVKLGDTEEVCILCGCEVNNPCQKTVNEDIVPPYPKKKIEDTTKDNRKFFSLIISILLILPGLITFFLNILYFDKILWSVYVIGTFLFIWIVVVPPILFKKLSGYFFLFLDYVSLILILFIIENLFFKYNWFFPIALPIISIFWVLSEMTMLLYEKKKIKDFKVPGIILIEIGILCFFIDLLITLHIYQQLSVSWSVFVLIPTVIIGLLFFLVDRNEKIKEELVKRFHF